MEARLAYKEMISTLEKESSEDVKQSDYVLQTDQTEENCALDNGIVPFQESEEDALNYSEFSGSLFKICKLFLVHVYIFIFKVNSFMIAEIAQFSDYRIFWMTRECSVLPLQLCHP